MDRIDRLLRTAYKLAMDIKDVFFPDSIDCFVESLGVDPDDYIVINPDGSEGYDFIQALNDTAIEDWKDCDVKP